MPDFTVLDDTPPDQVLRFWFQDTDPKFHFKKDKAFDREIRYRFEPLVTVALVGGLMQWRFAADDAGSARGRLAELLVLDQFTRNIYRDTPRAFAGDGLALVLAQEIVGLGLIKQLDDRGRNFALMPFMHSESAAIQRHALGFFDAYADAGTAIYARKHLDVLDRFGRFPHRNAVLGRANTPQEEDYLNLPGSGF